MLACVHPCEYPIYVSVHMCRGGRRMRACVRVCTAFARVCARAEEVGACVRASVRPCVYRICVNVRACGGVRRMPACVRVCTAFA